MAGVFAGRTALVTGGTSGIGRAIVAALAEAGAHAGGLVLTTSLSALGGNRHLGVYSLTKAALA